MLLTIIYIALVAWLLGLTIWNLYKDPTVTGQLTAVLVAITLLLRLLGVK